MDESRRRFLLGTAGAALATAAVPTLTAATPAPPSPHGGHGSGAGTGGHGGGMNGATFRAGQEVDHVANGFDPDVILRDFDHGAVSTMPDGRTLREWTVVASDKDIEVAPGVTFPAWTFDGRIPGPTLRATEGDLMRVRFVNDSEHPHTMHFHGIHPADMDGVPLVGRGVIAPGEEFVYEFDAQQPGQPSWELVAPHAAGTILPATVPGGVFDTGAGYPAWLPDTPGTARGSVVPLREPAALFPSLDAYEGSEYERIRVVVPDDGTVCWAYAWRAPTTSLTPLPGGWPPPA